MGNFNSMNPNCCGGVGCRDHFRLYDISKLLDIKFNDELVRMKLNPAEKVAEELFLLG